MLDAGELIEEMGSGESIAFQSTFYTMNACCKRTAPPPLSIFFFRSDNRCQYTAVWPVVWSMLVGFHYVNSPWRHWHADAFQPRDPSPWPSEVRELLDAVIEYLRSDACLSMHFC